MSSISVAFNAVKTGGYYTIECAKNLLSDVDSSSNIAGLTNLVLTILEDNKVVKGFRETAKVCGFIKDWSAITKLPGRIYELTSGKAVARPFFGEVNFVKIASRLCLIGTDFFNSVKLLVKFGGIAKETGTFLSFGLKEAVVRDTVFALGMSGWGADLIDATGRLCEEGPSLEGGLTFAQDLVKLGSIGVGRFPAMVPHSNLVKVSCDGSIVLLSIFKSIVKTYSIQVPRWMYTSAIEG